ncbi:MAG: 4Fe-4S dicluster domain-containing protein [Clostridiales Family XIII bacterium]|jgi:heterodisulfide reductase subunit C|nr:4Fe-4S dicluster domain-containing protein [Clostridiales Family XIII bacterium]
MKGKLNPDFKKQIADKPDGANVMNCYLCGACTAGCPVADLDSGYSPRTIMRMVLIGMKDALLSLPEIWKCSQCGRCTSNCPQNAAPSNVIKAVRELAAEEDPGAREAIRKIAALEDEIGRLRLAKLSATLENSGWRT